MRAGRPIALLTLLALNACGGDGGGSPGGGDDRGGDGGVVNAGVPSDAARPSDDSPFDGVDDPPGDLPLADGSIGGDPVLTPGDAPGNASAAAPVVTPVVAPADVPAGFASLRIVLTWNARPSDLDAHLTGPEPDGRTDFHVFSGNREAGNARLEADATTGEGPETIEVDRVDSGIHRYSVFNFSGDADRPLEQSGARVEVFAGDTSMATFRVPIGEGNLWTVFDIDERRIVPVDTIARLHDVRDYFPPPPGDPVADAVGANDALASGANGCER